MSRMAAAKTARRVTFTLLGHFDLADGVSLKDTLEAMNEVHQKVSENGAVDSFTAELPAGTIEIDGD